MNPGQHFSMADDGPIGFQTYWNKTQKTSIFYGLSYCLVWFVHALQPLEFIGSKTEQNPQDCSPSLELAVQWFCMGAHQ